MWVSVWVSVYVCVWVLHYRLVTYSDDIRYGPSATIFHDDPQVCVFEVAAIVAHHVGTEHRDMGESDHIHPFISGCLRFNVLLLCSVRLRFSPWWNLFPKVELNISRRPYVTLWNGQLTSELWCNHTGVKWIYRHLWLVSECLFKFSYYCFKVFSVVLTHNGPKLPQNLWGWWNIVIVILLLHVILYWSHYFSSGNHSLYYLQISRQSAVVQHPQALMRFVSQSESVAHVWRTLWNCWYFVYL